MCVCLQRDGASVANEGNHNGCVVDPTASLDRLIHSTRSFREDAIASASALSLEVCFAAAANPELFTWIRGIRKFLVGAHFDRLFLFCVPGHVS